MELTWKYNDTLKRDYIRINPLFKSSATGELTAPKAPHRHIYSCEISLHLHTGIIQDIDSCQITAHTETKSALCGELNICFDGNPPTKPGSILWYKRNKIHWKCCALSARQGGQIIHMTLMVPLEMLAFVSFCLLIAVLNPNISSTNP